YRLSCGEAIVRPRRSGNRDRQLERLLQRRAQVRPTCAAWKLLILSVPAHRHRRPSIIARPFQHVWLQRACRAYPVNHLVYASSSSVYGANTKMPFAVEDAVEQPVSLYAATKRANELMAYSYSHLYRIRATGLRFFTVYGPWGRPDMALFKFTRAILHGEPIDGVAPCQLFNIGRGKPVKLLDFILCLESALGVQAKRNYLPLQAGDVLQTWADVSGLAQWIDFSPQNLPSLLHEIRTALAGERYEVLVVDDGSTDDTLHVLQQIKAQGYDPLRILHHRVSLGQSTSIWHAAHAACGEWLATLDGDGQNDPADLPGMLALVRSANQGQDPLVTRDARYGVWAKTGPAPGVFAVALLRPHAPVHSRVDPARSRPNDRASRSPPSSPGWRFELWQSGSSACRHSRSLRSVVARASYAAWYESCGGGRMNFTREALWLGVGFLGQAVFTGRFRTAAALCNLPRRSRVHHRPVIWLRRLSAQSAVDCQTQSIEGITIATCPFPHAAMPGFGGACSAAGRCRFWYPTAVQRRRRTVFRRIAGDASQRQLAHPSSCRRDIWRQAAPVHVGGRLFCVADRLARAGAIHPGPALGGYDHCRVVRPGPAPMVPKGRQDRSIAVFSHLSNLQRIACRPNRQLPVPVDCRRLLRYGTSSAAGAGMGVVLPRVSGDGPGHHQQRVPGLVLAAAPMVPWLLRRWFGDRPKRRSVFNSVAVAWFFLWFARGFVEPYTDGPNPHEKLMAEAARMTSSAELVLVGWREGHWLFARQPLVHFGFADPLAIEHAALWLRTHPEAYAMVPVAEIERCFLRNKARAVGSTSRAEWVIVGPDADNGQCSPTTPARAFHFSWGDTGRRKKGMAAATPQPLNGLGSGDGTQDSQVKADGCARTGSGFDPRLGLHTQHPPAPFGKIEAQVDGPRHRVFHQRLRGMKPLRHVDTDQVGPVTAYARHEVADQLTTLFHRLQTGVGKALDVQRPARAQTGHLKGGADTLQQRHDFAVSALRLLETLLEMVQLLLALLHQHTGFKQRSGLSGQGLQGQGLALAQASCAGIDDADRSQRNTTARDDGRAGIEANIGRPQHQSAGRKAWVEGRIFDHQDIRGLQNRMAAKSQVTMSFLHAQAYAGLEPLALSIHQRNQRNGGITQGGGECDTAQIRCLAGLCHRVITDVTPQHQHGCKAAAHQRGRDAQQGGAAQGIDDTSAEERAQRDDHLKQGDEQRHAALDILGRHDKHPDAGAGRERTERKAPERDQHGGAGHAGGEVGKQRGADADHHSDQQQRMAHAAVGGESGEHIADDPGDAVEQEQRADGRAVKAGLLFEERGNVGIRGKVCDANGLVGHEPWQQENLRQQYGHADQRGDQKGRAPAQQAAQPGADRHAQHGREGHTDHDDRGGLRHTDAFGRESSAERNGRGPEPADADAQQHTAKQQQAEVAGVGHHGVGDDHDQRQSDQQIATVHGANADRQQRGCQGGGYAGQGHHQAGVARTDAQIAGNVIKHAYWQKLAGDQSEGADGDGEYRQPLLFDALLTMFG
nr:hypothetical protein [Tanacetum cinerariifolium]